MIKIVELTKENEEKYLDKIVRLEQISLEAMKQEGREGQLFDTGREGISEYVHSENNSVFVAVDEKGDVEATTYITQGQKPFTYNDITKYFKYGENYKKYVKQKYPNEQEYKKDLRKIYIIKIQAFEYAKQRILQEYNKKNNKNQTTLYEYLKSEIEQNGYHEKSELREKLNKYMAEYIQENYDSTIQNKYEMFYWITLDDLEKEFGKKQCKESEQIQDYEQFMKDEKEYADLIHKGSLKIYEKPEFEEEKYYTANTANSVEIDTYLTNPHNRSLGIARIIVYEGIKKHILEHFKNPKNQEIFLCSTLHRDNLSSKYVSEFFGLTDSLYVNRRQGRDREVHICKINREEAIEYLTNMYNKLAVLYNYNPEGKVIKDSVTLKVLQEQLEYEEKEKARLVKAKTIDGKLKGINHKFIPQKERKISKLKKQISHIQSQKELQK